MRSPTGRVLIVTALLLAGAAGCAPGRVAGPGVVRAAGADLVLERGWTLLRPELDGAAAGEANVLTVTRDGLALGRLLIAPALPDGASLVRPGFDDPPRWFATTGAANLEGFLDGSLAALGHVRPEVRRSGEAVVAGGPGWAYLIRAETPERLEIRGEAWAAEAPDGALTILVWLAPAGPPFARDRDEAARIAATLVRR